MIEILYYLGISLLLQVVFFIPAFIFKTDAFTDMTYSLTFIILAVLAYTKSPMTLSHTILYALILIWALRLGIYLVYRIHKFGGRDKRFDGMREKFTSFAKFWLGQGIVVWVLMIPYFILMTSPFAYFEALIIGASIFILGFLFESIADFQKIRFILNPKNKGKWIDSGLWSISRHPNYFGEILIWIGVFAITLSPNPITWVGIISPIFISLTLIFVTGLPPLEKSADKKWGKNKDYQKYKRNTSILIPFIK